jgi:hypothetical protein
MGSSLWLWTIDAPRSSTGNRREPVAGWRSGLERDMVEPQHREPWATLLGEQLSGL